MSRNESWGLLFVGALALIVLAGCTSEAPAAAPDTAAQDAMQQELLNDAQERCKLAPDGERYCQHPCQSPWEAIEEFEWSSLEAGGYGTTPFNLPTAGCAFVLFESEPRIRLAVIRQSDLNSYAADQTSVQSWGSSDLGYGSTYADLAAGDYYLVGYCFDTDGNGDGVSDGVPCTVTNSLYVSY